MYNLSVLDDLLYSMRFFSVQPHAIQEFVGFGDMHGIAIDYQSIGYQYLKSALKTDKKWFAESFGEPDQHMPPEEYFSHIRETAIARYCWKEFSEFTDLRTPADQLKRGMREWLRQQAKFYVRWQKIAEAETEIRKERAAKRKESLGRALEATKAPFVVADIETTGLKASQHEITEIAAVIVEPDGTVAAEFSSLLRTSNPIPMEITQLTGIDDRMVRKYGGEPATVLKDFLSFISDRPVFFHHAPFDKSFLNSAFLANDLEMNNEIFDTLHLARKAWPSLGKYRLESLARYLNAQPPEHRALADVRTTLAVLLASRQRLS
jgi:DNA polymerase-3 subunit epsilon